MPEAKKKLTVSDLLSMPSDKRERILERLPSDKADKIRKVIAAHQVKTDSKSSESHQADSTAADTDTDREPFDAVAEASENDGNHIGNDGYDFRENSMIERDNGVGSSGIKKRTNNKFNRSDLPPDAELYTEEELDEMNEFMHQQLVDDEKVKNQTIGTSNADDLDYTSNLSDSDLANVGLDRSEYAKAKRDFLSDYSYTMFPEIPAQYRAVDLLGLRTKPSGTIEEKLGPISPKAKLRQIWDGLSDLERYILILLSEHRHMTARQLVPFTLRTTEIRHFPNGGSQSTKPYFDYLKAKYEVNNTGTRPDQIRYKEATKCSTLKGLISKLDHLVDLNLIDPIQPSYHVKNNNSVDFQENPSLYTVHYYLSRDGAKVLICNTGIGLPSEKGGRGCGYVSTHKSSAFSSIVHNSECQEVMCSIVENAEYVSNIDQYGRVDPDDTTDWGRIEILRYEHEGNIEVKNVPYMKLDSKAVGGKAKAAIDFKTDGMVSLYSSKLDAIISAYLEYDSGSSTAKGIEHKVLATCLWSLWNLTRYGTRFRTPVLMLVSQNPGSFLPQLNKARTDGGTRYTQGIKRAMETLKKTYPGIDPNVLVTVIVTDCHMMRLHGALGACWHTIDLNTGIADEHGIDFLEAVKPMVERLDRGDLTELCDKLPEMNPVIKGR